MVDVPTAPVPSTDAGRELAERIDRDLPEPVRAFALEGVRRLMDYQDAAYARTYLDRLDEIRACDDGTDQWRLTREAARHVALWMSYEDTIRVADLKVRATRFDRVRQEVGVQDGQLLGIVEYMHPRLQEVCETLPAALGRRILASPFLAAKLRPFFTKGRHVRTSSLRWFVLLSLLAGLRRWRRGTLRYRIEQERIRNWLDIVRDAAASDPEAAAELVECQGLVKGYGETFERGLANFNRILSVWGEIKSGPAPAAVIRRLRQAALEDDESCALDEAVAKIRFAG